MSPYITGASLDVRQRARGGATKDKSFRRTSFRGTACELSLRDRFLFPLVVSGFFNLDVLRKIRFTYCCRASLAAVLVIEIDVRFRD